MSVIVTGAAGHLGRLVADQLLERIAPEGVVLVTRHPEALAEFAARGSGVRYGDFDDPASLADALAEVYASVSGRPLKVIGGPAGRPHRPARRPAGRGMSNAVPRAAAEGDSRPPSALRVCWPAADRGRFGRTQHRPQWKHPVQPGGGWRGVDFMMHQARFLAHHATV